MCPSNLRRVLFAALLLPLAAKAQLVLTGTSYTQDFNSLSAGLPSGWSVRTGASSSALGTAATPTLTAGSTTAWSDSGGAFKNVASSTAGSSASTAIQTAAADRALGIRQTGSVGDPGAAFTFNFNSSGKTLTSLALDLLMLSVQTRSTTWTIEYGLGASPTSFTSLGTYTDPGVFGTTAFSTSAVSALSNQTDVWVRIVALGATTGSGSRDTFAIDNFTVNFTAAGASISRGAGTTFSASSFGGNAFTSSDIAVFDGSATSVALSGAVVASGLKFSTTGYTLSGTASDSVAVAGSVEVDNGITATISGKITGSNAFSKTSPGTLVLSGLNDFVGNTSISAGTLSIDNDANLGNTANDVSLGGTLATTATISLAAGRDITGSGTLNIANGTTLTTNGTLNAGTITLSNTGSLSIQGASNTASGVVINSAAAISGNALTLNGNLSTGTFSGNASIGNSLALGSTSRTATIDGSLALNGNLTSTSSARLQKRGTGILTLAGDNSGLVGVQLGAQGASGTYAEGGTIIAETNTALGASANQLQINSGNLTSSSARTFANGISIGGRDNGIISVASLSGANMEFTGTPSFFRATGTTGDLRLNVNNTTTLSGNFTATSGSGTSTGINLGGTGTLILSGTNSALTDPIAVNNTLTVRASSATALGTGVTTVNSGATLAVATGVTLSSNVTVNSGGTLTGTGTAALGGIVNGPGGTLAGTLAFASGSSLAPGSSPGLLNITGAVTFNSGAQYTWELGAFSTSTPGTNFDQLIVANGGSLSLLAGASLVPSFTGTATAPTSGNGFWTSAQTWTVVTNSGGTGTVTGTAFSIDNSAWSSSGNFATALSNNEVLLTWTPSAIPEPSTYAAIFGLVALGGAIWHRRRRGSKPSA